MPHQTALDWIDGNFDLLHEASQSLWHNPEPSLKEYQSAALLADILEQHGFDVQRGVADMPTAFVASYTRGDGPTVAFLGEYDALPELSQAAVPERQPVETGGYGHGCGHNLLGTGALGAALATKVAIEAGKVGGTVRFYGCPAEEILVGKVFMVRAGLFDDCDLAITWHPASTNQISSGQSLAMNSARFNFHGVSAHAAVSPEAGRSALDAVELMNVGVNYLREHVTSQARIHYVISNGGLQPNVVPSYSQVWYYVRAPHRYEVEEIYGRILEIAQGASMMAGVEHDVQFVAGCYDTLYLETLLKVTQANLERIGGPDFDDQERAFARQLASTHPTGTRERVLSNLGLQLPNGEVLCDTVLPDSGFRGVSSGSTDVGDVSWNVPTAEIRTACWPIGNAGHSWQNTASAGTTIGTKGMVAAAKAMSLTGLDALSDPELIARARAEFHQRTAATPYACPIPDDVKPEV